MENKEKQVEEMVKDLEGCIIYSPKRNEYNDYILDYNTIVERLVKKGWIKLPEDRVVLSREQKEEYEQFKSFLERNDWENIEHMETTLDKCQKVLYERLQQSRKEMAEKCLNFVKEWVDNDEECLGFLFDFEDFITRQFGVEIKEN